MIILCGMNQNLFIDHSAEHRWQEPACEGVSAHDGRQILYYRICKQRKRMPPAPLAGPATLDEANE
ncbi:hypothetical protein [Motiliproteus sp. SC1-56]|uniref:hypothetical protein n=1 Tax=Motiliproteus sp. SC1-56 TaxID=2799565 RepID=UPI001A906617|nr:hypothetical protein [Motiliproteus sp. SC1-56]